MNPKVKKPLTIFIPIALSAGLVWYSLQKVPFSTIIEEAKQSKVFWIFLSVVSLTLSHISRAYRWLYMLEPLGFKIKFQNSLMAVFSAYLINYGIPRSGEVARATILSKYEDVPFEKGFGTIIAERVVDTVVMLVIIAITLLLQYDFIIDFFLKRFKPWHLYIIAGFLVVTLLLVFVLKKSKLKIISKIKGFFNGLLEGLLSVLNMKKKWQFIFHTLFIWGMYLLMFYTGTQAFEGLKTLPLSVLLIGFIAGSFSIAATNGGTGGYPEAIFLAFSLFAISGDLSRAFGWVLWGIQTLMTIILGGLSLIYLPIYNRTKKIL